ncbi:thiamine pyrophosphate-binding protein [Aliiglaciecola sp. 3_MG-2023]|uniref:thiamine pyrophosphate-dependent enzyme n=1 Tax=Aliiglaciecola sp. 3_MG-2023 TaxID=3062644 RepID=UPI0026E43B99|nr:thiamine pyrophosphate-dependent enzyme [Aliiglaciecola sp. 3_MG-2023]MDO6694763.1 thiamine pyrophosphate-binding protein [Aliiglaciecola sp. 3_MG-2023]
MTQITCSDAIIQYLIKNGVDTIFGIPGAQTYAFFDALSRYQDKIKLVVTRHEQGAGYMAYGYAKSTGKIGVYCVVPGPGVLNSTAALCTAHNTPVLCITGEVPSEFVGIGHGMLHELDDQLGILKVLTKWAARINHSVDAPAIMSNAFTQLSSGRKRPVAIEVPMDIFGQKANVDVNFPAIPSPAYEPLDKKIKAAVEVIRKAKNPMIMVGSGAVDAKDEILKLAKLLQAPVVSFRGGRGIVSDDSPYGFNCAAGYKLYSEVDVMIGIGSRMELPAFRWQTGVATCELVRIDIDPTQLTRLRGDVSIVADATLATQALLNVLEEDATARPSKEAYFNEIKAQSWQEIQKVQPQMTYLNIIRDVMPRDGFIVEEISQVGFTSWLGFPVYEPRHLVTCGYQGNLGHGIQTGMGVKVANPDKVVMSIAGDGGFMFGVQELATAVQFKIGLIILLFNNNAYGNVRRDQINFFDGNVVGSELTNPDFVKLVESFGAKAYQSNSPEHFKELLEQAVVDSEDGPVVIEIPCERGSEASVWEFLMPAGYGN